MNISMIPSIFVANDVFFLTEILGVPSHWQHCILLKIQLYVEKKLYKVWIQKRSIQSRACQIWKETEASCFLD
jgi:hypothetical protein